MPLICALKGPVIGAGACLATGGCDIRIAEPSTKIAFNFVKIGLHPGEFWNVIWCLETPGMAKACKKIRKQMLVFAL